MTWNTPAYQEAASNYLVVWQNQSFHQQIICLLRNLAKTMPQSFFESAWCSQGVDFRLSEASYFIHQRLRLKGTYYPQRWANKKPAKWSAEEVEKLLCSNSNCIKASGTTLKWPEASRVQISTFSSHDSKYWLVLWNIKYQFSPYILGIYSFIPADDRSYFSEGFIFETNQLQISFNLIDNLRLEQQHLRSADSRSTDRCKETQSSLERTRTRWKGHGMAGLGSPSFVGSTYKVVV